MDPTTPPAAMDSSPRRWVLKPLSPLLQPSDLRTMTSPNLSDAPNQDSLDVTSSSTSAACSHSSVLVSSQQWDRSADVVVQAWQVAVFQDGGDSSNEWLSSSLNSPSSSSGSHCGFYSFVEDPTSPEAELNEAWMISPQRQTQLATLKEEQGFILQTYSSSRRPQSLFSDSNGDCQYKVGLNNSSKVVQEEEEKKLRKEIIRSQAPKKKPTFKDQMTALENLDLSRSANKLIEGFSLSYGPVSSRPELSPAESAAVDKKNIDFSAARKQFLMIEQEQLPAPLNPLKSSKTYLNMSREPHPDVSSQLEGPEETHHSVYVQDKHKPPEEDQSGPKREVAVCLIEESCSEQSSVFDHLDSGLEEPVEADGSYTSEDGRFNDITGKNKNSKSSSTQETPIEREIRLAQEREEKLRRSRGLKYSDSRVEMVEIKTKRLQLQLNPFRTKEKNQVSFIVQNEFQCESQKMDKLQQKGEIPELCGLDPPQELGGTQNDFNETDEEKRREDWPRPESGDTEAFQSPCCPHRHSEETKLYIRQMGFSPASSQVQDMRDFHQDPMTPSTYFSTSPLSPMPLHLLDKNTIRPWTRRESLQSTGLQSRRHGAPDFIKKEIEEALRREHELQELRASREESYPQLFSPSPLVENATKMATNQFCPPVNTGMWSSSSLACYMGWFHQLFIPSDQKYEARSCCLIAVVVMLLLVLIIGTS